MLLSVIGSLYYDGEWLLHIKLQELQDYGYDTVRHFWVAGVSTRCTWSPLLLSFLRGQEHLCSILHYAHQTLLLLRFFRTLSRLRSGNLLVKADEELDLRNFLIAIAKLSQGFLVNVVQIGELGMADGGEEMVERVFSKGGQDKKQVFIQFSSSVTSCVQLAKPVLETAFHVRLFCNKEFE